MKKKKESTLQDLEELIAPPELPAEAGPESRRAEVERALGLSLPSDLYEFAAAYGTGFFQSSDGGRLLEICNPFSAVFVERVTGDASTFRDLKESEGDSYIPFGVHPERPGLLPFGSDDNGRFIFWLTDGQQDRWPILLWPLDRKFVRIDRPLIGFLARLFGGEINCWGGGMNSAWFKSHLHEIAFKSTGKIKRKRATPSE